jgi:hypothetical protein
MMAAGVEVGIGLLIELNPVDTAARTSAVGSKAL